MGITEETSRRMWELLCSNGQTNKYAVATYQANARSPLKNEDSSLIAHLRRASWILDSEGKMRRPGEVSLRELNPIYSSAPKGFLIEALQFGSDASAQQTAEKSLLEAAKSLGRHVLSDAEYQDYLAYKEKTRKAEEKGAREKSRHNDAVELGVLSKDRFRKSLRLKDERRGALCRGSIRCGRCR